MNLLELNKLDLNDLKKIDYKQFLQDTLKRPDLIVDILVILISLVACMHFYSKNQNEIKTLRNDVANLESKTEAIDEYNTTNTELESFIDNIPEKITEEDLIDLVTNFAVSRNIQIKSFSPTKNYTDDVHEVTSILLRIVSENYKDIWFFIHDIENAPFPLRIDRLSGSMVTSRSRRHKTTSSSQVNIEVEITSVNFKK